MTRVVDKKATKVARARHARGVDHLNSLFAFEAESHRAIWLESRRTFSAAERGRRRQVAKAQRLARRRNRA